MQAVHWLGTEIIKDLKLPLKTYAFLSGTNIENIIIGLHGFGDNAQNFAFLGKEIPLANTLWLFLEGPEHAQNIPFGAQWFPLFADPIPTMKQTSDLIGLLLKIVLEVTKVSMQKVFVLGFSQGGCMALYSAHRLPEKLGGIVVMSGWTSDIYAHPTSQNIQETPVFITHGLQDNVVFPALMFHCSHTLQHLGVKVSYKTYNTSHTISPAMAHDVKNFIEAHR